VRDDHFIDGFELTKTEVGVSAAVSLPTTKAPLGFRRQAPGSPRWIGEARNFAAARRASLTVEH
jgi:hypothetical protein